MLGTPCAAFLGAFAGNWNKKRAAETQSGTLMLDGSVAGSSLTSPSYWKVILISAVVPPFPPPPSPSELLSNSFVFFYYCSESSSLPLLPGLKILLFSKNVSTYIGIQDKFKTIFEIEDLYDLVLASFAVLSWALLLPSNNKV